MRDGHTPSPCPDCGDLTLAVTTNHNGRTRELRVTVERRLAGLWTLGEPGHAHLATPSELLDAARHSQPWRGHVTHHCRLPRAGPPDSDDTPPALF